MEATLASIIAAAAPLVFAAVGETITERAGVVNLSLDGSILLSAMTGFAVASLTGSVALGFGAAAGVSAIVALIVAWSGITVRMNQIAVGFILTLLAADLSSFLGDPFVRQPGPQVVSRPIPVLSDIPVIGRALFGQNLSVYASLLLVIGAAWFLGRSRIGREAFVESEYRVARSEFNAVEESGHRSPERQNSAFWRRRDAQMSEREESTRRASQALEPVRRGGLRKFP